MRTLLKVVLEVIQVVLEMLQEVLRWMSFILPVTRKKQV